MTGHSHRNLSPSLVKSQAVMETTWVFLLLSCLSFSDLCSLYSTPVKMMLLCSVCPVKFRWIIYHPLSCSCLSEAYCYFSLYSSRAMHTCLKLMMRQILETSFLSVYTWRWHYSMVVVIAFPYNEHKTLWWLFWCIMAFILVVLTSCGCSHGSSRWEEEAWAFLCKGMWRKILNICI